MLKFQAVKQTKTYAGIVEQISKLIEQGELKPGERLPSERSLSSALNIGRQSLREALSVLEAIGLLEVRHGIGTFVKQDAMTHLTTLPKDSEDLINPFELLEARRVIEVELVSLAAKRATPEQIEGIKNALKALQENEVEGRQAFELDRNVHLSFARGANNEFLYRTMLQMTEQMSQQLWIIMKERSFEVLGRGEKDHKEHEAIFNAIKSRDPKLATQEMLKHLKNIERAFLQK